MGVEGKIWNEVGGAIWAIGFLGLDVGADE